MLAFVALICLAIVSASSANEAPHGSELAKNQWFQNYMKGEMMKSENFKEVFEPILQSDAFHAAPCSYMMESYLRSGYEYVHERYPNTMASKFFYHEAGEKVRQCAEQFYGYSKHMPIMMLEWSFDELFKRVAKLNEKADHVELFKAAQKLAHSNPKAYDRGEVCKVAAAINKLRKDESSPLTQEIVRGETEVRGSSLVTWSEKVGKNMEAIKEVDCKQELARFFEDTCKADLVANLDGLRYVALALELKLDPKLSERAQKYQEYNRVCMDAKSNPFHASR